MKREIIYILLTSLFLSACDNGSLNRSNLFGYYTDLTAVARTSEFDRINKAIDDHECIYTTGLSHKYDVYATPEIFFDSDGMWNSGDAHYGTCRFIPKGNPYNGFQIIDSSTIIFYIAWLWDPHRVPAGYEVVGRVYAGKYFGELVYCSNQMSYHTYTKVDNKLFLTNGDIFTITSSGLIKDGSSKVLSKYDPSKRF